MSVNGTIFDVSGSRRMYGPGGAYGFFGGKECSFSLATNCLNYEGGVSDGLGGGVELNAEELRRLKGWIEFFERKYFKVGVSRDNIKDGILKVDQRKECIGKGH